MAYYRECQRCGATLDPQERCDCLMRDFKAKIAYERLIQPKENGQLEFNFESEEKKVV